MKISLSHAAVTLALSASLGAFPLQAETNKHSWTDLVSNIHGISPHFDTNLVDCWGLAPAEDGKTIWVANNHTGTVTHYSLTGDAVALSGASTPQVIAVPPAAGLTTGSPTGLVLNRAAFSLPAPTNEFVIDGKASQLLVVTEDGQIGGFNPGNPGGDATRFVIKYANPAAGAAYTGVALATVTGGAGNADKHRLFAVNYGSAKIDVLESDFTVATTGLTATPFTDPQAVTGYAPYNILRYAYRNTKTKANERVLIVSYVNKADPAGGGGYINIFKTDGSLLESLVDSAPGNGLSAPWGMAVDRNGAKQTDDILLVGNFGDGTIHRFSLANVFAAAAPGPVTDGGTLDRPDGAPLIFDNLWALHYGQRVVTLKAFAADDDELDPGDGTIYFSAGIPAGAGAEEHGLVGRILSK